MKKAKIIPQKWTWAELAPRVEPLSCILLNGPGNDFIMGWDFSDHYLALQGLFDFETLDLFLHKHKGDYVFGYLSYDIKNVIEPGLKSENDDLLKFPDAHFVSPNHVLVRRGDNITYFGDAEVEEIVTFFTNTNIHNEKKVTPVQLTPKTSPGDYHKNFGDIKAALQYGSIYEMNYCQHFFSKKTTIEPFTTFQKLNAATEAPFSCYLHFGPHYALCASPERYLKKTGNRLISQPIKGTAARGMTAGSDEEQKNNLRSDEKERAENIMIVDLVRNDLSQLATKNSVQVDELCGVYTFKTVHQLISTVSCELKESTKFSAIVRATFPMGSMTGAPKISAMQQIEKAENFRRGLYSGTIGYIDPNGDFDFNVVIRSILYNSKEQVVTCSVGGAITINADAQKEYDECLLKLSALQKALC